MWKFIPGAKPPDAKAKPEPKAAKAKGRPKKVREEPSEPVPEVPQPVKRQSSTQSQMKELQAQIEALKQRLEPQDSAPAASGSNLSPPSLNPEVQIVTEGSQVAQMAAKITDLQRRLEESEALRSQGSASSSAANDAFAEKIERAFSGSDLSTPESQGEHGAVMGLLGGLSPGSIEAGQKGGSSGSSSGVKGSEKGVLDFAAQKASAEAGKKWGHLGAKFGSLGGRPKSFSDLEDQPRDAKDVQVLKKALQPSRDEPTAAAVRRVFLKKCIFSINLGKHFREKKFF